LKNLEDKSEKIFRVQLHPDIIATN